MGRSPQHQTQTCRGLSPAQPTRAREMGYGSVRRLWSRAGGWGGGGGTTGPTGPSAPLPTQRRWQRQEDASLILQLRTGPGGWVRSGVMEGEASRLTCFRDVFLPPQHHHSAPGGGDPDHSTQLGDDLGSSPLRCDGEGCSLPAPARG